MPVKVLPNVLQYFLCLGKWCRLSCKFKQSENNQVSLGNLFFSKCIHTFLSNSPPNKQNQRKTTLQCIQGSPKPASFSKKAYKGVDLAFVRSTPARGKPSWSSLATVHWMQTWGIGVDDLWKYWSAKDSCIIPQIPTCTLTQHVLFFICVSEVWGWFLQQVCDARCSAPMHPTSKQIITLPYQHGFHVRKKNEVSNRHTSGELDKVIFTLM